MKEVAYAMDAILRGDDVLTEVLGPDQYGNFKIYDAPAPQGVVPPYVVFQVIPGRGPIGTYSDAEALDGADVQVTCWGRNRQEVWQIYDLVREVIRRGDWSTYLSPVYPMRIWRRESPGDLPDADTKWRQIPTTWRVDVSR